MAGKGNLSHPTRFPLVLILALLLASCTPKPGAAQNGTFTPAPTGQVELSVFAAASLTEAFGEIGQVFEAGHPGVTVLFNFAGSQQLAQQINEGAPADVFASASQSQMNAVIADGGIASNTQRIFARNRLVVVYPRDNPGGLKELKDLAHPGLKLVFASKEVPVGEYSLGFLDNASSDPGFGPAFKQDVLANVVSYEDNVKVVLAKVALGEADAGIVYTSDISVANAAKVAQLDIPDAFNVVASYPIAPVKESAHPDLAQAFIDLALSQAGQDILAKHHFIPVK